MGVGRWAVSALLVAPVVAGSCAGDDAADTGDDVDATEATAPATPGSSSAITTIAASPAPPSSEPRHRGAPVVVDTDLAADDLVALAFLLESPDVDVRAITVSGTGEVRCPGGLDVVRGLLVVTGDSGVPTACGRSTPLAGDHEFPAEWRDGADAAYGLALPSPRDLPAVEPTAVELLDRSLAPGVTLLTLGPLTNVAEAFRADPSLAEELASIVVMGGALDADGNVSVGGAAPLPAEWNLYVDPTAAAEVVASGAPVVLSALDASEDAPVTSDFVDLLAANAHTDVAQLVLRLLSEHPAVVSGEPYYFWDPLAAAAVVDPALVDTAPERIAVVTAEGDEIGRTVRSSGGSPVEVAIAADRGAFEELLVRTLDGLAPDRPLAQPPPVVAEVVVRAEGRSCSYDGPTSVAVGRMRVTLETGDDGVGLAVVHLTGALTAEEVLEWIRANPQGAGEPPGIDDVEFVEPGGTTTVTLEPGIEAIVCGTDAGAPDPFLAVAASIEVG